MFEIADVCGYAVSFSLITVQLTVAWRTLTWRTAHFSSPVRRRAWQTHHSAPLWWQLPEHVLREQDGHALCSQAAVRTVVLDRAPTLKAGILIHHPSWQCRQVTLPDKTSHQFYRHEICMSAKPVHANRKPVHANRLCVSLTELRDVHSPASVVEP
jgi:hypothetical protein